MHAAGSSADRGPWGAHARGTLVWVLLGALLVFGLVSPVSASHDPPVATLSDTLESALAAHPDVAQARYDLRKAELELAAARAKVSLPSVQLGLSPFTLAQGADFPGTTQGSVGLSLGLTTGTSLSFELNPTYRWATEELSFSWRLSLSQRYDPARPTPSEARALSEAEAKLTAAQQDLDQAREGVVLAVLQSYASLLSSQSALADNTRNLARAQDTLAAVEAEVEAGQTGELQRLEAEIALRDAEIAARKRAVSHATALEDLARTIGVALPIELAPSGNIGPELLERTDELLAWEVPPEVLARSRGVQSARDAVKAATERLRALQVAAWPVPSVGLSWTDTGWRVSLNLSVSLFMPDRGAQRQVAQAELDLAQDRLTSAWREAERSLAQARSTLEDAREALIIHEMQREKLALERRAAEIRRDAGLVGPADWEAFLLREERFEHEYEQRLFSLLQAYLRYRRALGLELNWEGMVR